MPASHADGGAEGRRWCVAAATLTPFGKSYDRWEDALDSAANMNVKLGYELYQVIEDERAPDPTARREAEGRWEQRGYLPPMIDFAKRYAGTTHGTPEADATLYYLRRELDDARDDATGFARELAALSPATGAAPSGADHWHRRLGDFKGEGLYQTPEKATMPTKLFDELRDWLGLARRAPSGITCECERGPREAIEDTDAAGVRSWRLASHCTECLTENRREDEWEAANNPALASRPGVGVQKTEVGDAVMAAIRQAMSNGEPLYRHPHNDKSDLCWKRIEEGVRRALVLAPSPTTGEAEKQEAWEDVDRCCRLNTFQHGHRSALHEGCSVTDAGKLRIVLDIARTALAGAPTRGTEDCGTIVVCAQCGSERGQYHDDIDSFFTLCTPCADVVRAKYAARPAPSEANTNSGEISNTLVVGVIDDREETGA